MKSYGRHSVSEDDIAAVVEVLRGDWLTQGPVIERFEAALCACTGASHAVAVNSGSAALYVTYAALGLGPGKRMWTSPITFVATSNAALMLGAQVEFVDVDPKTGNLSVLHLREKLAMAYDAGCLPDMLVPVHLTGRSCPMQQIRGLADQYGIRVVEDASHALGGTYQGETIGICRHSDAAVFSFHPVKSITTGEGGAVTTNSADLAESMREIRHHGITRDRCRLIKSGQPGYYHEQQRMGFNFRLSDIHAALGCSQLTRLGSFVQHRRDLAAHYHHRLADIADRITRPPPDAGSAWHLYAVNCRSMRHRDNLYARFLAEGVRTAVHYLPVYSHPWYRQYHPSLPLVGAEAYANTALTLPLHTLLTESDIDRFTCLMSTVDGGE